MSHHICCFLPLSGCSAVSYPVRTGAAAVWLPIPVISARKILTQTHLVSTPYCKNDPSLPLLLLQAPQSRIPSRDDCVFIVRVWGFVVFLCCLVFHVILLAVPLPDYSHLAEVITSPAPHQLSAVFKEQPHIQSPPNCCEV